MQECAVRRSAHVSYPCPCPRLYLNPPFEKGYVKDFYAYRKCLLCASVRSAFYFQNDLCLSQQPLPLPSSLSLSLCGLLLCKYAAERAGVCACVCVSHSYALLVRRLLSPISLWLKPLQLES